MVEYICSLIKSSSGLKYMMLLVSRILTWISIISWIRSMEVSDWVYFERARPQEDGLYFYKEHSSMHHITSSIIKIFDSLSRPLCLTRAINLSTCQHSGKVTSAAYNPDDQSDVPHNFLSEKAYLSLFHESAAWNIRSMLPCRYISSPSPNIWSHLAHLEHCGW